DYGAGSAKEIAPPPMVEASPRPLTKLAANEAKPIAAALPDPARDDEVQAGG
ncbi:MAG: hypothetical protein H0W39_00005, partial [Sphingomonas sp.]|nr:hypothetical protein [Sphingomonas sp.]